MLRLLILLSAFVAIYFGADPGYSQVKSTVKAPVASAVPTSNVYVQSQIRHELSTYYDPDDFIARQTPSLHARLKAGMKFYGGDIDVHGTVGVFKETDSQLVMQRRPEIGLDLQLFRNAYAGLVQYNVVQLPFSGPTISDDDRETEEPKSDGSIYYAGIAPYVFTDFATGFGLLVLRGVNDFWTTLYSRRQYTSEYEVDDRERDFALFGTEEEPAPVEDKSLHYTNQVTGVVGLLTNPLGVDIESSLSSVSRFSPRYEFENGKKRTDYGAERYSFYKVKLRLPLTDKTQIENDFYQYFGGFFAEQRRVDERRFRNVLRLAMAL